MKKPIERINSNASVEKVTTYTQTHLTATGVATAHISNGNSKLDGIKNVSLPPVVTCGGGCKECKKYCYAVKIFNRLPDVRRAWADNLKLFITDSNRYFDAIVKATAIERVFRWHVSGDIVNKKYFDGMVQVALARPHCDFLAFTKQFEIVNAYIANGGTIPCNLHVIYSASPNAPTPNPYRLPECHINFANAEKNTYNASNFEYTYNCTGNCRECVINGCGCFFLKHGDAVVINQH